MNQNNVFIETEKRIIYFHEGVSSTSIATAYSAIHSFITIDDEMEKIEIGYQRPPIHLHINSPGGSIYDMWALVDLILTSQTPIYTYCYGYAMSAAFVLFICGHRRFIAPHATLMYHQLSSTQEGTYANLAENFDELTWLQSNIEQVILSLTDMDKEILSEVRTGKRDLFIHSQDAIDMGIADEIINFLDVLPEEEIIEKTPKSFKRKKRVRRTQKKEK